MISESEHSYEEYKAAPEVELTPDEEKVYEVLKHVRDEKRIHGEVIMPYFV